MKRSERKLGQTDILIFQHIWTPFSESDTGVESNMLIWKLV